MRLILGLDAPDSGSVTVGGRPYAAWRRPLLAAGALLEAKAFHGGRTARNHLLCLALTATGSAAPASTTCWTWWACAGRPAGGPAGSPSACPSGSASPPRCWATRRSLMLDEPVNGLDPEGVVWIRTLLRTLAAEGRTVLLSSHLMSEMAMTADRLVIIGRGRLIAQATMADFLAAGPAVR